MTEEKHACLKIKGKAVNKNKLIITILSAVIIVLLCVIGVLYFSENRAEADSDSISENQTSEANTSSEHEECVVYDAASSVSMYESGSILTYRQGMVSQEEPSQIENDESAAWQRDPFAAACINTVNLLPQDIAPNYINSSFSLDNVDYDDAADENTVDYFHLDEYWNMDGESAEAKNGLKMKKISSEGLSVSTDNSDTAYELKVPNGESYRILVSKVPGYSFYVVSKIVRIA